MNGAKSCARVGRQVGGAMDAHAATAAVTNRAWRTVSG